MKNNSNLADINVRIDIDVTFARALFLKAATVELRSRIADKCRNRLISPPWRGDSDANRNGAWLYACFEALERLSGPDWRTLLSADVTTLLTTLPPAKWAELRDNCRALMHEIGLAIEVADWEIYFPKRKTEQLRAAYRRNEPAADHIHKQLIAALEGIREEARALPVPPDPEPSRFFLPPDEEEIFWQLPMLPATTQTRYRRLTDLSVRREQQLFERQDEAVEYYNAITDSDVFVL